MTSGDNTLDMSKLELLLREHFARTEKQLADIRKDNADFRSLMISEFNAFEGKINSRLDAFEGKINSRLDAFEGKINMRFDKLETAAGIMQNDITGLKHDVAGLYHWDYWLLSIILVVFAMPQIVAGIKALFGAIAEGISAIVAAFRQK